MAPTPPDPVIDEIREIRHAVSARFDHDPKRLFEYYLERQKEYRARQPRPAAGRRRTDSQLA